MKKILLLCLLFVAGCSSGPYQHGVMLWTHDGSGGSGTGMWVPCNPCSVTIADSLFVVYDDGHPKGGAPLWKLTRWKEGSYRFGWEPQWREEDQEEDTR